MTIVNFSKKSLCFCLVLQMVLVPQLTTMAQAEMISTETAIDKYAAIANRDYLLSEIQRQEVRDEIIALGIDPAEAEARLEALSDAEIAAMMSQIEGETVGAGANGIVGALLTVFIILLVTDLLCLTKVFSFTRCAAR